MIVLMTCFSWADDPARGIIVTYSIMNVSYCTAEHLIIATHSSLILIL